MTSRIGPLPLAIKAMLLLATEAPEEIEEIEAFKKVTLSSSKDNINKS